MTDKLVPRARGPGRPAHEPTEQTREQVRRLAAYGLKHDAIAAIIFISDETLRKHYAAELQYGLAQVIEKVANSLIEKALSDRPDAVGAAKFFLQSQGGWAEKTEQTTTIKHEQRIDRRKEAIARAKQRRDDDRTSVH